MMKTTLKSRSLRFLGFAACFMLLFGSLQAAGTNLLSNPGFEDGLTGWDDWGGTHAINTVTVHSGINSLAQTGDGGMSNGLGDALTVGADYILSAWCVAPDGATGRAYIGVEFKDADGVRISVQVSEDITNTAGFEQYIVNLTVPAGTVSSTAYLYQEGGSTDVIVDDFVVMEAPVAPTNLVVNPGFEDGLTSWNDWGGTHAINNVTVHSGLNALAQTGEGGMSNGLSEAMVVGEDYVLSAWCVAPDGATGTAYIGVEFKDADGVRISVHVSDPITNTAGFEQYIVKMTVPDGTTSSAAYLYQEGGSTDIIVDDFSVMLDVPEVKPVLLGTGFDYKPSYVNVTGGGEMPDTTDGVIAICDGTGATDVTAILQSFLDSAAAEGKPMLLPATDGFYMISERLLVNTSVMGIGGMPTIKQTGLAPAGEPNGRYQILSLQDDMTGWIYNLHLVGTYDGSNGSVGGEFGYNIALLGVNGVTIMNNISETPQGDHVADDGGAQKPIRNVLITNNTLLDAWRCGISASGVCDRWAIFNNYMTYYSQYVNPIDIEPYQESSYCTNFEVGYNEIISPNPAWNDQSHFYDEVFKVTAYFDRTPGGNVFSHHNWGVWGVQWMSETGFQGGESTWFSVEDLNNVAGDTIPASNPSVPTIPTKLTYSTNSKTAFTLTWDASTAEAGLKGYLIYQNGRLLGTSETNSYEVTGLECGNTYLMNVKAYDMDGSTSGPSLASEAAPLDCSGGINLLVNPGFESDLSEGWTEDWGNSTADETAARSGMYGLKLGGAGDGGRAQLVTLIPDSSYTLMAWARMSGTGLDAISSYIGIDFRDADGARIDISTEVFTDTADWKQYYLTVTVPANTVSTTVFTYLEARGTSNEVFTDDYALVGAVPVTAMTLNKSSLELPLGIAGRLVASIEPANAIIQEVSWVSSDTSVAKVSENGLVQAWKEGSAVITATSLDGDFSQICDVTVGPRTDNLVKNPGIEQGLEMGWTSNWGGIQEAISDPVHSGSKSMSIGPSDAGRAQEINGLIPGSTYTLSAWGLVTGTNISPDNHYIGIDIRDGSNQRILLPKANIVDSLDWGQNSVTFTFPLEAVSAVVYAYQEGRGDESNKLLTDDWGLVSGWEALPYEISSDASASGIFVTPGKLTPAFDTEVTSYTVLVPEGTSTVTVKGSSTDPSATVSGDGTIDVSSGGATVEVLITAQDGITTMTYTVDITVDAGTGIKQAEATGISLYPNPLSEGQSLNLKGVEGGESLSILDMTGREVFNQKLQGLDLEVIRLSDQILEGSYVLKVRSKTGTYSQILLIK